jgi:hypothetical protein
VAARFEVSTYSASIIYAHYDAGYSPIASIMDCPKGYAIRWYHIEGKGANEIAPTMEAAKALVEQWIAGMDIEPWE